MKVEEASLLLPETHGMEPDNFPWAVNFLTGSHTPEAAFSGQPDSCSEMLMPEVTSLTEPYDFEGEMQS